LPKIPVPTRDNFRPDLIAGLTVAMLILPQSMAYAELAGLPPHWGLYGALVPVLVAGLWGSLLGTGPVALTGLVAAGVLAAHSAPYSDCRVQLMILLAFLVGLVRIFMAMVNMAALVNFVAHPVVSGFSNGAALTICITQLPTLLGIKAQVATPGAGGVLGDVGSALLHSGTWHLPTLAFGLGGVAFLLAMRRLAPKFPAPLGLAAASIPIAWACGFGGSQVGVLPKGLPDLGLSWNPELCGGRSFWEMAWVLLPAAIIVTFISFLEILSVSKAISLKTRRPMDLNHELMGQGAASVAGAFAGAMVTSSSFSRSALNVASGAKSGMSSIYCAGFVSLVLLFCTDVLTHLPKAVLAAIIIVSVFNLMDFAPLRQAWKVKRGDGWAALLTFVLTVALAPDVVLAFCVGTLLCIGMFLYRAMRPEVMIFGRDCNDCSGAAADLGRSRTAVGLRYQGSLFFASIAHFEEKILEAVTWHREARHVIIAAEGMNGIDASGEWGLRQLILRLKDNGISLAFAGLPAAAFETLSRAGLVELIGAENFHPDLDKALRHHHEKSGVTGDFMI
jgi:SulP family sulfate permease